MAIYAMIAVVVFMNAMIVLPRREAVASPLGKENHMEKRSDTVCTCRPIEGDKFEGWCNTACPGQPTTCPIMYCESVS
jgi:hypothetical protein